MLLNCLICCSYCLIVGAVRVRQMFSPIINLFSKFGKLCISLYDLEYFKWFKWNWIYIYIYIYIYIERERERDRERYIDIYIERDIDIYI